MDFHSMKRKELQALCKKHKIPANLTNLEMANRLTSLLKGKDGVFTERRSCLKVLDENGCEIDSDVEIKRVKKVRFSPDTEMFEFEKSEARVLKVKRRGKRKSVINEISIVENVGKPELSEGVEYVTRSRGRRLVDKGVAEKKERKGVVKDGALRSNLPSAVDVVASTDVDNQSRVMTRRSLRRREMEDEGKSKKEDMEKGCKKKGRERNLREGKDKAKENVDCMEIQAENLLRRSERNVTKVDDHKLMSSRTLTTGSSLKPVNTVVSEVSDPSRLDIDAAMEFKERSRVGVATRRSRRNASGNEPLITLDDLVAEVNYERKMKKQRRDPVEEQEVVLVDSISIELPLAPLSPNIKRSEKVAGKFARKAKRKSRIETVEIEDSLPEDLTTKEPPAVDVQPSQAEVAEGATARDSDNEGLIHNLKKRIKRSGKNSRRKSSPKAQDSSKGVNGEITVSESNAIEPGTETSHCRTDEVDQSGTTDLKGIQVWVELSIDTETMSRPVSLDHLVEDKSQKYIEQQGLESVHADVLEHENASLHGPCEIDGSTSSVKDETCDINPANSEDADPNYNGDHSSIFSLDRSLELRDLSLNVQTNDVEVENVAGDRNFDQEALICTMLAKSDENSLLEENSAASDKFYESNFPEPSRSATKMLEDGNVKGQEDSEEPADMKGKHLGPPSIIDANIVEINCAEIEYGSCISSFGSTTNALELNLTSEDPVSGTIGEGGHSFLEDTDVQEQEKSVNVMDLDKHSEPRKQSLSIHQNDGGPDNAAEAEKHFVDAKISSEQPKFDEENILGKIFESNLFDSSGCNPGMLGFLDANVGKDFVSDIDAESLVLAAEDFASHIIDAESNKSYRVEPERDGDADLVESCIREIEKVDNNFGEPKNFKADESISVVNLNTTLEQREQTPIAHCKGSEAGCVGKVNRNPDRVELKYDELSKSADDRPLEERCHSPTKCWKSSISDTSIRSARSMLWDEIDDAEDSVGLHKSAAGLKKSYEAGRDKDENAGFIQSCATEECISAKRDDSYRENPLNSDIAMTAMKCGTGDSPCESVLHNNEGASSTMNLDISLEQREHSPVVDRNACEADSVAEVDMNYGQLELKSEELSISIEDRSFYEKCHFPRNILQGSEDSLECQKNTTSSRKTFEDGPDKDANTVSTDSHVIKKCTFVQVNNYEEAVYSENPMGAIAPATGNFSHIPLVDNNNEHTGSRNSEMALNQREQTPVLPMNGCHSDNVAEDDKSHDQLELYCNESAESVEDRCLEEDYRLPNEFLVSSVSYSSRSAGRMLQDEIVRGSEDPLMHQEKSREVAPEDGNAGSIECYLIDGYTTTKDYEGNPENSRDAMEEISRTVNFAHIPVVVNNEDYISTMNFEITLEKREESALRQNGGETGIVSEEDGNNEQELRCDDSAESVEGRPSEEHCKSPDKQSASDPSRRILEDRSANAGKDFNKSSDLLETSKVPPSLAAEAVETNCSATEESPALQQNGCKTEIVAEEDGNNEHKELRCDDSAESVEGRPSEEHCNSPDKRCAPDHSGRIMEDRSTNAGEDFNKSADLPETSKVTPSLAAEAVERNYSATEESLALQKNACETDIVAEEDGNIEQELRCDDSAESVEGRPSEVHCKSPDKRSSSDSSRRILEDRSANAGEYFNKSADLLETFTVTPAVAAEAVHRNCSKTEFSSSISNVGSTDPLDSSPTLDGPEFKEASGDVNKSGHSTFPDTSAPKQEDIMDAMDDVDAFKTCEEVSNYVDLASFERGNNNAVDVGVAKFQDKVLAVQRRASLVIEASDTSDEGIHSHPSDNDAQQQGLTAADETFTDNRKEDSDGISDKISDFASAELSEAKFNINNFQDEFNSKGQGDHGKENGENLTATFSQVQFTMSDTHNEEKIVDITDDVSLKLYKHHEILKESDVADTINEYIESESNMNPSVRIDGQEKNEAANLEATALGSAWISESKTATTQSKNSDVVAGKIDFLGKQFTSEMGEKNVRAVLIRGAPKKLQMVADMKENVPNFKMEKVGCLTTVKPTNKRPALKDILQKKK